MVWRDKLTRLARIQAQRRIVSPVIIKTKPGRYVEVAEQIRPFVERLDRLIPEILPRIRAPDIIPFASYPMRVIPRFNMVSSLLPREVIWSLAESRDVERIYPDSVMWTLHHHEYPVVPEEGIFKAPHRYPVVPEEGIFKAPHRVLDRITFTSSYWVKVAIGADIANRKGFTGRGVLACSIDTGVSRIHEQTRKATFETTTPLQHRDENGHGTHVTSIIGGVAAKDEFLSQRSRRGVICEGMAPQCGLLGVKSLGYIVGIGSTSDVIEGLDIGIDRGASIINLSFGGPSETEAPEEDPYFDVFEEVLRYNVIPVCAAGNSGPESGTVESPGSCPNVLTVGAYDPMTGEVATFSSRGPTRWGDIKPDIVMPGVNIDSGTVGVCDTAGDGVPSRFSPLSGTSMAAPVASGLITLMRQCHRDVLGRILTMDEIKAMMSEMGHEKNPTSGWGALTWSMYEHWLETEYSTKI